MSEDQLAGRGWSRRSTELEVHAGSQLRPRRREHGRRPGAGGVRPGASRRASRSTSQGFRLVVEHVVRRRVKRIAVHRQRIEADVGSDEGRPMTWLAIAAGDRAHCLRRDRRRGTHYREPGGADPGRGPAAARGRAVAQRAGADRLLPHRGLGHDVARRPAAGCGGPRSAGRVWRTPPGRGWWRCSRCPWCCSPHTWFPAGLRSRGPRRSRTGSSPSSVPGRGCSASCCLPGPPPGLPISGRSGARVPPSASRTTTS